MAEGKRTDRQKGKEAASKKSNKAAAGKKSKSADPKKSKQEEKAVENTNKKVYQNVETVDFNFALSQKLVIELTNFDMVLEGSYVYGSKDYVAINNIFRYEDPLISTTAGDVGCLSFYRREMLSISVLLDEAMTDVAGNSQSETLECDRIETSGSGQSEAFNGRLGEARNVDSIGHKQALNCCRAETKDMASNSRTWKCDEASLGSGSPPNVIQIKRSEYDRLMGVARNYTFVNCMDKNYFDAVNHLLHSETVALEVFSSNTKRMVPVVLAMASWEHVYIFDIAQLAIRKTPEELKDILESEQILKVVHGAKLASKCLQCYKIEMKHICDTQLADVIVRRREGEGADSFRSFSECLFHYFNLPEDIFQAEKTDPKLWEKRPLHERIKGRCALTVTFLIELKIKLYSRLLKEFRAAVAAHVQSR